jgi:RNA polymerase sigma factor (sigma-70 family)
MKKLLALMMAVVLVLSLTACGGNKPAEPDDDGPDEEEIRYSVAQVKEACKKLPAGYRVILSLYLFEGYDMEEIASILKIRPSSVRSQYLRAKRKLLDIIAANKENG